MVMATDVLHAGQQIGREEEDDGDIGEAAVLHERLVRHVLAVNGELETRSDVWGEHSYARARGAATSSQIRSLLSEPEIEAEPDDFIDVETAPRGPPSPPLDRDRGEDELEDAVDDDEDDEWEERLAALAPSAAHARLASVAIGALRDLRLERLAGARGRWARREGACAAARRVRRALAAHWGGGAAWLHAALLASLPRELAALYSELVAELRRAVPRLADRLPAPRPAAPRVDPLAAVAENRDASAPGPWFAWAPGGCEAEDERWVRRLGALLHTRHLRAAPAPPAPPAPPDRWCAALAHDARTALADMLTEAGSRRAVILGGVGAGAALAAWLAAGGGAAGRVRGVLLLAPPLLTAEGPRDRPDDVLEEVEVPLLAVVGGGAAQCWRGAAAEVACRFGEAERGSAPTRRVLMVAGADDALRLPRAHRRRLRLPQQALDAAIAEECARWASEAAEAPPRARRRAADGEEGRAPSGGNRSVEIVEGRVVSRGPGGSPLALLPPRRLERPERHELAAADIMQLPIVFADDEPPRALAGEPEASLAPDDSSPLTLTVTSGDARPAAPPPEAREERSRRRREGGAARGAGAGPATRGGGAARGAGAAVGGALKYTRVIVAKRGARPVLLRRRAAPAPAPPASDS